MAEGAVTGSNKSAATPLPPSRGLMVPRNAWVVKLFKKAGFKIANGFLIVAIASVAVYFVQSVYASIRQIEKAHISVPEPGRSRLAKETAFLKDNAFYLESIQERDIFKMGPKKPAEKIDEIVSSAAVEATKSLKLVGISWSDNPDAIIEDERTKQTYFVKKGGMVGDVKVESIFREKVILKVGQEAIELR